MQLNSLYNPNSNVMTLLNNVSNNTNGTAIGDPSTFQLNFNTNILQATSNSSSAGNNSQTNNGSSLTNNNTNSLNSSPNMNQQIGDKQQIRAINMNC